MLAQIYILKTNITFALNLCNLLGMELEMVS